MRFKHHNIILVFIFFFSCEPPLECNPLDPICNEEFAWPETTIINEAIEGSVLDSTNITIYWSGSDGVIEYSHNLDEKGWSVWDTANNVILDHLDEGNHFFQVKGRFITETEDPTPANVSFSVDAINGPSIRIYPLMSNIKTAIDSSEVAYIEVFVEEVSNLANGEFSLSYNNEIIDIVSIENGAMLLELEEQPDVVPILFSKEDVNTISVNFSILSHPGLNGSGSIIKFAINSKSSGSFLMEIINPVFQDANADSIAIQNIVNGQVNVE